MPKLILKPSKPLKKTAEKVKDFLSSPNRRVFFFDEGRFGLKTISGRCWALKSVRKISPIYIGYKNFYIYSSVSPQEGDSFSLFLPWVNTEMMNLYLEQLSLAYPELEIMLIMDQAGWHVSKKIKLPDNILIESLPPYSPELNPAEKLWQWLKFHVCRNHLFQSDNQLENALVDELNSRTRSDMATLCHCSYL
jgi:transposase